jgi:hypothetical protein
MANSGYVPKVHHPDVLRAILCGIVETGDVRGTAGPGRTVLTNMIDDCLIDELVVGTDLDDRELEEGL